MYTAIVLLAVGMGVAVAAGALGDHGELIARRNLAADRAERAAVEFVEGCGSRGCDAGDVNTTRADGTVLTGCVYQAGDVAVLRVGASVGWTPGVFLGLTPATATAVVELGGFGVAAGAVLEDC